MRYLHKAAVHQVLPGVELQLHPRAGKLRRAALLIKTALIVTVFFGVRRPSYAAAHTASGVY